LVQRKRLCAAIESPYLASITTIVAGAGFGKTTLTRQWAEHSLRQVYWIDLKQDGRDRARFMVRLSEIGRASTSRCPELADLGRYTRSRRRPTGFGILN